MIKTWALKFTYGWIKKGENKPLETTANRTRINLIGAMELDNISGTIVKDYQTINGESIIDFMEFLREQSITKGKIYLILDGAGYHRCASVGSAAKKLNIELS